MSSRSGLGLDDIGPTAPYESVDEDAEQAAMLQAVGFRFSEDAGCWVHKEQGRVISKRTVAAHDTDWLAHWITGK